MVTIVFVDGEYLNTEQRSDGFERYDTRERNKSGIYLFLGTDNNLAGSSPVSFKPPEVEPLISLSTALRSAHHSLIEMPIPESVPVQVPSSFVPKPFPPPSLSGVPVEYIIDQLRNLASNYWDKPESADCTIIVPVPHPRGQPSCTLALPQATQLGSTGLGRRATDPSPRFTPRISLRLHSDYLSSHSILLRGLFSGASPLDLINTSPSFDTSSTPTAGKFSVPSNRLPRLLPSSPTHPTLFLPVPDPSSFHLLVHWMYFGRTCYIEDCLDQGIIQWEGIARNVEYLGLPAEMKVFLGRWYSRWLEPERCDAIEDDGEFSDSSDESEDDDMDDDSTSLSSMEDDDRLYGRGRSRGTRPLSMQRPRSA